MRGILIPVLFASLAMHLGVCSGCSESSSTGDASEEFISDVQQDVDAATEPAEDIGADGDAPTDPGVEDEPVECPVMLRNCGGECVNTYNHPDHCGGCFNPCPESRVCYDYCQLACPSGTTDCSRACVNLDNDPFNCGECGNECDDYNCVSGGCW